MAADFNKPTVQEDAYIDVLGEIRAQFEVVSTMSYGDALNTKVGAVQFLDGSLQKWSGSSFDVVPVSITGGGTGASTAAGARTALNVNEKGTLGAQVRSNAESDALYVPQARTITTAGALNGGNSLDSNISLTVDSATTGQQGVVQLFNGLNSTSTTQALTAAQGKVLGDRADVGYYNSQTLSPSGSLAGGSCKVVRVGDLVTISGFYTHASLAYVESPANYLPTWARPSASVNNYYSAQNLGAERTVSIVTGTMYFQYNTSQTSTSGFTISYTV